MAEKMICPRCGGVAYTASPQVKTGCPYCGLMYNHPHQLYHSLSRALKERIDSVKNLYPKNNLKY